MDNYKSDYDRDGFVVIRQLLPAADFAALQSHLDDYIRDVVPALPDDAAFYHEKGRPETLKQMQHMGQYDPFFEDYASHPKWTQLAETLVGESATAQNPEWFNKPPGTEHATPPHQDNYYFNLAPPNVVTIWMALDPVDESNGCLRYLPGSHRAGFRPHAASEVLGFSQAITDYSAADESREAVITLEPGDVACHHGMTIHRADANHSNRNRRSFAMVFKGVSCRRDEERYRRYEEQLRRQHESKGLAVR